VNTTHQINKLKKRIERLEKKSFDPKKQDKAVIIKEAEARLKELEGLV
jgi:hypothetical protein